MRIAVAGLGIIGASLARALKANTKHTVDGWNRSKGVLDIALERGYIDGVATDMASYDLVFVALPPAVTVNFITQTKFKDNAIVADICGVKVPIEKAVYATERNYRYVGTHPMAGKETNGIESSSETLYKNANIVITECAGIDKEAEEIVCELYRQMGCKRIVQCSAAYHDEKIAYTSQLAHIVSNAYIKSVTAEGCEGFTGGSFQDMTRVAPVDENVWTELFFENKDKIEAELKHLIDNLTPYLDALKENDPEKMKKLLAEGKQKHRQLKK